MYGQKVRPLGCYIVCMSYVYYSVINYLPNEGIFNILILHTKKLNGALPYSKSSTLRAFHSCPLLILWIVAIRSSSQNSFF